MGESSDALRAGQKPKITPTLDENMKASTTACGVTTAAQPANCAPIAREFLGQAPRPAQPTIAEGTAIAQPIRLREVLGVLAESQGGAVMLTEEEIAAMSLRLAREGVYVEPTCAQAAAAFERLLASGAIGAAETTVVVLTGSGLKATPRYAEMLGVSL